MSDWIVAFLSAMLGGALGIALFIGIRWYSEGRRK